MPEMEFPKGREGLHGALLASGQWPRYTGIGKKIEKNYRKNFRKKEKKTNNSKKKRKLKKYFEAENY